MKKALDPSADFKLSIWAFSVSFGEETDFKGDWAFIAGQGVAFINNLGQGGLQAVKDNFDMDKLVLTSKGGKLAFALSAFPKSYKAPDKIKLNTVISALSKIGKGVADYAAPYIAPYTTEPLGIDLSKHAGTGVSKGVEGAVEEVRARRRIFCEVIRAETERSREAHG